MREDKSDKPDYTLIPKAALDRIEARLRFGSLKYTRDDWKNEIEEVGVDRFKQSLLRHCIQFTNGDQDEDHLGAILCNASFIAWYEAQEN